MEKQKFKEDLTYLPCTMKQFEDLTNEMLEAVNVIVSPHFLNGDYVAQLLMQTIHSLDHKYAIVSKSDLFEGCINRLSNHITFHAVEEIKQRLQAEQDKANPKPLEAVPDLPVEH